MFFLTGTAASSALDLISTLQQTLGGNTSTSAPATAPSFDPATAAAASSPSTAGTAANAPSSLLAPSTLDALLSVQGQGQSPIVNGNAFSQQLFSLLDSNQDGSISKSEFETAFGQNGNTAQADSIFSQLDANGDGSISPQELTNALDGQTQGQGQGQGAQQAHHHHHHGGGAASASGDSSASGGASAGGGAGGGLADALSDTSQTVTNSDGSTTTSITYADGSQVQMTLPAATSSGSSGSGSSGNGTGLNNYIERMIEQQAQMLASSTAGQSLAISA